MTLHEAYQILGLRPDADPTQVKAAYRHLAAEAHPDRGGKAADFIRIRAAYEILSAFFKQGPPEEDIPVPPGLRMVIDNIVADFRAQKRWAETEAQAHLTSFDNHMTKYIEMASRMELSRFSKVFNETWYATINALFSVCNSRCDSVIQQYEAWYTENTQAFFDSLYRRELLSFAWRRRFWEAFLVLGAIAAALSVVVGWTGSWRPWISTAIILVALAVSFLVHRWSVRRRRETREKVEPLSVLVFEMEKRARFPTETTLRRGRLSTAALGLAGVFLGNAASAGLAVPVMGMVAGAALGGTVDRLLNPTARVRESMTADLRRFMAMARPQVTTYVLRAHEDLLAEVSTQIVDNYKERVEDTVKLLKRQSEGKDEG